MGTTARGARQRQAAGGRCVDVRQVGGESRCSAAFALVVAPSRSSSTSEVEEEVAKTGTQIC